MQFFSAFLCIFKSSGHVGGKSEFAFCLPFIGFFSFYNQFYCILQIVLKGINQKGNFKIFNKTRKQCLKKLMGCHKSSSRREVYEKRKC